MTDWFWTNSDPAYRETFNLCEDKGESETFLVTPQIAAMLEAEPTLHVYTIFTAKTRIGTLFLFPVRQPGRDGKWNSWHRGQQDAAERAMKTWLRMIANKDVGAYDLLEAPGNFAPRTGVICRHLPNSCGSHFAIFLSMMWPTHT